MLVVVYSKQIRRITCQPPRVRHSSNRPRVDRGSPPDPRRLGPMIRHVFTCARNLGIELSWHAAREIALEVIDSTANDNFPA